MKKTRSFLPCFIVFFLLGLLSCQNNYDIESPFIKDELEGLSIEGVQQWFNEKHNNLSSLRQSSKNKKVPNWRKSLFLDFKFGEAVVTPLVYEQNYSVSFIKNKKDNTQTPRTTILLNSLSYLVVYKDKDDKYIEEIVNVIPEENYLVKSKRLNNKAPFDGMINVYSWDGELTKGYIYENGKIIGDNLSVNDKNLRLRLLDCYTIDYYLCPSENLTSSGEIMSYAGCDFMFSSTACFNLGGSSASGGGGDTYSDILGFNAVDTPLEKTRKLAAKVPQAFKQNLQCVPFANALKKAMMNSNISGKLLEVRSSSSFIISDLYNNGLTAISTNGYHAAIRVGDTVFDNLNPNGVDYNSWRGALDSSGGITVTSTDF
ncbi:papain fold toxin domain-containing protein [Fibrella forsythiae]|uniref:Tox-PL-2 domain-containing protein n=1 Tax=Fibrella forsythiae TaxID=2817061 RepID=A0ABS3JL08_9BACT|nr:papain fold toxin domain-containing protein [Fibrella forsythiae]MBO0950685.1 hypothetical protein [Fibrella forsythiae]